MGIPMPIAAAPMAGATAAPGAVGSASAKPGAAPAAGGANSGRGFAGALGKLLSGNSGDNPADALTLTLAALLGGLTPTLAPLNTQAAPVDACQISGQISSLLSSHPEILQKLLSSPGMQMWLNRAEALLAQGNPGEQGTPDSSIGFSLPANPAQNAAAPMQAGIPLGEAQDIVGKLLAAAGQEPDSVLYQQLVQDLKEILAPSKSSQPAAQANDANTDMQPGQAPLLPESGAMEVKRGIAERNVSVPTQPAISDSGMPTNVRGQITKLARSSDQLQVLAAKAVYTSGVKVLSALVSDRSASQADVSPAASDANPLAAVPQPPLQALAGNPVPPIQLPTDARGFVQDMSQFVVKNFKVIGTGALSEAKLTLSPANLGHVDVKISLHDGQVVAHFVAQTLSGKEMLESQLPQLKTTLQSLGMQVGRLDVTQNGAFSSGMFQEHRQQQSSQQQFGRQSKGRYGGDDSQPEDFSVKLQDLTQLRSAAYGNRFNVTA